MTPAHFFIIASVVVDIAYGILVYLTNSRRTANQQFLTLTVVLCAWMLCVWNILTATTPGSAEDWVRNASAVAQLVPTAFFLLRISILNPDCSWIRSLWRMRWGLLVNLIIALMCMTKFFLVDVVLPQSVDGLLEVAEPRYGPGFIIFNIYYLLALLVLVITYGRDARRAQGIQRMEIQFVLLACGACILTGTTLALIIPAITGSSRTAPMAPVCAIVLNAIIAYGIATQRIMGVALVLRRATAYAVLAVYLTGLYMAVTYSTEWVLSFFTPDSGRWPELLASLTVAFSLAPANGWMQRVAQRLFLHVKTVDVSAMVQQVGSSLQSISTVDEIVENFIQIIGRNLTVDRVTVLLANGPMLSQVYPRGGDPPLRLDRDSVIPRALQLHRRPLIVDTLRRRQLPTLLAGSLEAMAQLKVAAAVGLHFQEHFSGIVLLGARLSGRVYGAPEEDALQIVCNELAVALENARLFTETRNSRIYNDILLDNLGTGVVAINNQQIITVFNRDAQRILRTRADAAVGKACEILPEPLPAILTTTLSSGIRHPDEEVSLRFEAEEEHHIRVGSSVFHSHTGETLGALIVFHDVTHLKALQGQIRRSDRLASLGTLSAGMAHEIKNPLVTIKTFTQLLPERYDDIEFRESFLSLVGIEVKRIDTLVTQLLSFARPSKPTMTAVKMHQVIDDSLRLVAQQLEQHQVRVLRDYQCHDDTIQGDADLLSQAFVNLFLNAQDAMTGGGTLRLTTNRAQIQMMVKRRTGRPVNGNSIVIRVEDSGIGIKEEDLGHIFDPFFTTKSHGTGLGLAVAHGIIDEQGGMIDVQSQVGVGTAFLVTFPLARMESLS